MKDTNFRPPCVPLVTADPYFSVWSFADRLTDDYTRHWTGARQPLTGMLDVDGKRLIFMGRASRGSRRYFTEPDKMEQTGLAVGALTTTYTFEGGGVRLAVDFTSPLLIEDPDLMSRPVTYLDFHVSAVDGRAHRVRLYLDAGGELCVDTPAQRAVPRRKTLGHFDDLFIGSETQRVLAREGDDLRIDWGAFHLVVPSENTRCFLGTAEDCEKFARRGEIRAADLPCEPVSVGETQPLLAAVADLGEVGAEGTRYLAAVAYDDIHSILYFGKMLDACWRRSGQSFDVMVESAINGYTEIKARCDAFAARLAEEAEAAGGSRYAELAALVYRQSVAAHKAVYDEDGKLLFLSKECFSNGCIGTLDVTFPSAPLFLIYNAELVRGMLRPIFRYANSEAWKFGFAPHDVGCYPIADGQRYDPDDENRQMPVEESGNILILTAAVCLRDGDASFARKNWALLEKWGRYLEENGLDPKNQLCTDDFAGHLAHNCNLSVKAILGVASYAILSGMLGHREEEARLMATARAMAGKWCEKADDGDHTRLAFDRPGTWSLKYNLIWDVLFGTSLFDASVARRELACYEKEARRYGTPLDSRASYTKSDWLIWAASLADQKEDFEHMAYRLWNFASETPDRVPFTDWYETGSGMQVGFQARSVMGGLFMRVLREKKLLDTCGSCRA